MHCWIWCTSEAISLLNTVDNDDAGRDKGKWKQTWRALLVTLGSVRAYPHAPISYPKSNDLQKHNNWLYFPRATLGCIGTGDCLVWKNSEDSYSVGRLKRGLRGATACLKQWKVLRWEHWRRNWRVASWSSGVWSTQSIVISIFLLLKKAAQVALVVKELLPPLPPDCHCKRRGSDAWVGKISLE